MSDRLGDYQRKRDFAQTPEPAGGNPHTSTPHFVVQHHLATADHYDFRLEIDGVLVSWAVPKGPSTDPRVRRMAKRTEDHPLDYETFEGVIGKSQYGGGVVQVWDRGTFANTSHKGDEPVDAAAGLANGHLSFVLSGQKINGGYSLIRTNRGDWLLVKKKDDEADARRRPTSTETRSVLTGRTLDEIRVDGPRDAPVDDERPH